MPPVYSLGVWRRIGKRRVERGVEENTIGVGELRRLKQKSVQL
jgi:hypothetical protein